MADLEADGLDREAALRLAAGMAEEPAPVRLPAAMRPLVDLVIATLGQWRMAGGGMGPMIPVALDLAAVDVAARWLGIAPAPRLLRDLAVIEAEALKAMRSEL